MGRPAVHFEGLIIGPAVQRQYVGQLSPRHETGQSMRVSYAIVFVSDMARSVGFYRDTLELPLRFETPAWTEFATDGATLALHATEEPTLADAVSGEVPAGRCRPGFEVADLDEFHARMIESNVPCTQEPKDVFGTRLAQYVDPDGLAISVAETNQG